MALKNKLGITDSAKLAQEEEKKEHIMSYIQKK